MKPISVITILFYILVFHGFIVHTSNEESILNAYMDLKKSNKTEVIVTKLLPPKLNATCRHLPNKG